MFAPFLELWKATQKYHWSEFRRVMKQLCSPGNARTTSINRTFFQRVGSCNNSYLGSGFAAQSSGLPFRKHDVTRFSGGCANMARWFGGNVRCLGWPAPTDLPWTQTLSDDMCPMSSHSQLLVTWWVQLSSLKSPPHIELLVRIACRNRLQIAPSIETTCRVVKSDTERTYAFKWKTCRSKSGKLSRYAELHTRNGRSMQRKRSRSWY